MNINNDYQIISLGKDCIPRTALTNFRLMPSRAQGRKTMPFDLGCHSIDSILHYLNNDFADYFENFESKYDQDLNTRCWTHKIYKNLFPHDCDCNDDFQKFINRYTNRINTFREAVNLDKLTAFVYLAECNTQQIHDLYETLKKIRKEKPFKLIVLDYFNNIDENLDNENIAVFKENYPFDDYYDWFKPEYQTAENKDFLKHIADFVKLELEKCGIVFPELKPQKASISNKIKNFVSTNAKKVFEVYNDLDKNRKVLNLCGLHFKLKTLHNENPAIIKLDGRMANQMFQYAFGKAYAIQNESNLLFDDSKETLKLNCFRASRELCTVDKPLFNKILRYIIPFRNLRNEITELKFKNFTHYEEEMFCKFQPELLEKEAPAYFQGFFQSEKYFKNIRKTLLREFKLIEKLSPENQEMLNKINATESISIHFRRGDYTKKRVADIFGACEVDYYKKGINHIVEKTGITPTLFVFSDDINWVKNNINFDYETIYVDIINAKPAYFDLELMRNCKHNIIANSSFSWWGAWLNQNKNKIIIAPKIWMKTIENDYDIIPTDWIRL